MKDQPGNFDKPIKSSVKKNLITIIYSIAKDAFKELNQHDPLLLSSSVAFFTLFALPPILIIVINILSALYKEEIITGKMYDNMQQIFGKNSADQIQRTIENFQSLGSNLLFTILGTIFLIFVGTTLFSIIRKSLNQIWQVRQRPQREFVRILRERIISLAIILGSGALFMAALLLDALISILKDHIGKILPNTSVYLLLVFNQIFSIAIVTVWIAIIFKYLPDIRLKWKVIWVGAIFTGILFTLGKYVLGHLLINSNISNLYGAAGSIVLFLLFIFYSSMILFFGASFTKVYAHHMNYEVEAKNHAVVYEISELTEEE